MIINQHDVAQLDDATIAFLANTIHRAALELIDQPLGRLLAAVCDALIDARDERHELLRFAALDLSVEHCDDDEID